MTETWTTELALAHCLLTPADQAALRQAVITHNSSLCPAFYRDAYLKVRGCHQEARASCGLAGPNWQQQHLTCVLSTLHESVNAGAPELPGSDSKSGGHIFPLFQGDIRRVSSPILAALPAMPPWPCHCPGLRLYGCALHGNRFTSLARFVLRHEREAGSTGTSLN